MENETGEVAGSEPIAVIEAPADTGIDLSVSEAGRALAAARHKPKEPAAESAETATADPELSGEDNAAPQNEATGETKEADPAAKPPLELPRSWTKDRAEHWAKLDPGTQEFLLEQDRKASAEVRRVQNEAAEKLKGLTAKEQEVEKVRQQYEARQAAYTQALETTLQADFGDIRSMDDVRKLQAEDPFRFQAWQVRQMELSAAQAERQQVESAKQSAAQTELDTYKNEQDKLFHEYAPELADPKKKADVVDKAIKALVDDLGFKRSELDEFVANPTAARLLFHHAFQKLVYNHLKLSDLKAAPKAVAKSDLPPVVRPGTPKPPGSEQSEQIKALTQKLNETGDIRIAQQLRALQVQRRAS
jgi:hypothetical protein